MISVGILLLTFLIFSKQKKITFYGIAATKEVEINYNLPVIVKEVFVQPGNKVKKGTPLLRVGIVPANSDLLTNDYKKNEVLASQAFWEETLISEIKNTTAARDLAIQKLDQQILNMESELRYNKEVTGRLESISAENDAVSFQQEKIDMLKEQRISLKKKYATLLQTFEEEKITGSKPFQEKMGELDAQLAYEADLKEGKIIINAPVDGIIGEILCKPNTYFEEFENLMVFYESHPEMVKGYVYENNISDLKTGDKFEIESSADNNKVYRGTVLSLGSRIVEIPERLRKLPQIKTYGREINITIDSQNNELLQKEKVMLELINSNK
jgi:multidrug resistance efflux pump